MLAWSACPAASDTLNVLGSHTGKTGKAADQGRRISERAAGAPLRERTNQPREPPARPSRGAARAAARPAGEHPPLSAAAGAPHSPGSRRGRLPSAQSARDPPAQGAAGAVPRPEAGEGPVGSKEKPSLPADAPAGARAQAAGAPDAGTSPVDPAHNSVAGVNGAAAGARLPGPHAVAELAEDFLAQLRREGHPAAHPGGGRGLARARPPESSTPPTDPVPNPVPHRMARQDRAGAGLSSVRSRSNAEGLARRSGVGQGPGLHGSAAADPALGHGFQPVRRHDWEDAQRRDGSGLGACDAGNIDRDGQGQGPPTYVSRRSLRAPVSFARADFNRNGNPAAHGAHEGANAAGADEEAAAPVQAVTVTPILPSSSPPAYESSPALSELVYELGGAGADLEPHQAPPGSQIRSPLGATSGAGSEPGQERRRPLSNASGSYARLELWELAGVSVRGGGSGSGNAAVSAGGSRRHSGTADASSAADAHQSHHDAERRGYVYDESEKQSPDLEAGADGDHLSWSGEPSLDARARGARPDWTEELTLDELQARIAALGRTLAPSPTPARSGVCSPAAGQDPEISNPASGSRRAGAAASWGSLPRGFTGTPPGELRGGQSVQQPAALGGRAASLRITDSDLQHVHLHAGEAAASAAGEGSFGRGRPRPPQLRWPPGGAAGAGDSHDVFSDLGSAVRAWARSPTPLSRARPGAAAAGDARSPSEEGLLRWAQACPSGAHAYANYMSQVCPLSVPTPCHQYLLGCVRASASAFRLSLSAGYKG